MHPVDSGSCGDRCGDRENEKSTGDQGCMGGSSALRGYAFCYLFSGSFGV